MTTATTDKIVLSLTVRELEMLAQGLEAIRELDGDEVATFDRVESLVRSLLPSSSIYK